MGIFARLVWLQVIQADELSQQATSQYREKVILKPYRGMIYDRNGRSLTDNVNDYYSVSINPYNVTEPKLLAQDLNRVTGRSVDGLMKRLRRNSRHAVLARKITQQQVESLKEKGWRLNFSSEVHRRYPHKTVAGQLIGFTDIDNRGISGIEMTFNELLHGKAGWRVVQLDVRRQQHFDRSFPYQPQQDGGNLVLTIDISKQLILEEEIRHGIELYRGKSASGLIIDPWTGEVIAMVSSPPFDPNQRQDYATSMEKNLSITEMLEPGSTFKLIPAALLLENYLVSPDKMVDCGNGYITIQGETIHDSHGFGCLTFKNVFVKSSNIGMIKLTAGMDHDEFYKKIHEFGFLESSDIELSGEAQGEMPTVENWSGLTRPNVVIGQGIAVTALQMAMAYCCVANDGNLLKPTLVRELRYRDGRIEKNSPQRIRRVLLPETARTLKDFLREAVENGTGKNAKLKGMSVAGKTGTAEIVNLDRGGYYKDRFIASFVGFFPVDHPRYLIMIVINDPRGPYGEHTGGNVCAPIFRKVVERLLGLEPELWAQVDSSEGFFASNHIEVPDLSSRTLKQAKHELKQVGLSAVHYGSGVVYDQVPAPGAVTSRGDKVNITLGPKERLRGAESIMPVLTGLSLRDAIRKATESGLIVKVRGSGRVIRQSPVSGKRVTAGEICSIVAT